jgi:hypothetical protein
MGSFHEAGVGASVDPTIKPARLLPEVVDETASFGSEAGGGLRVMTAGLRVVTSPKGAIVAAEDRLPQPPLSTTALPQRLGGGFLFLVGSTLWRADRWLGPAKPIFTAPQGVQGIVAGLDRVYLRSQNAVMSIDGRSGEVLDLGPWPAGPFVASYAAADGWRAAAVTDLRGVVATFDAGATWRPLELPLDAKQIVVSGDSLAIGGFENGRTESWYELRADGSLARLGAPPHEAKTKLTPPSPLRVTLGGYPSGIGGGPPGRPARGPDHARPDTDSDASPPAAASEKEEFSAKTFGKRPLATAIEDGWPLKDGTAVIARDGALARVRISDGALTELVRDAFPLKPARCHPVTLTRPSAPGAFGFVCGEPRGATVLYAYEPVHGRLVELKHFDKPRVVASSGNGSLAVRGPCAEDAESPAPPLPETIPRPDKDDEGGKDKVERGVLKSSERGERGGLRSKTPQESERPAPTQAARSAPPPVASEIHPYCVFGQDNTWREVHVRGDVGGERVVALADGRIVVISPPQGFSSSARITVLDKGRTTTVPVQFPRVTNDVGRMLRLGLWLDGFEERRPGVVGGWIEAGGVMLGLEIGVDGRGSPGQYLRDAGLPFVSGKYGLGWTASRRGYETTNGGMTWTPIEVPDPLVPLAKIERRACGPIGCLAQGWLRVGWGEAQREAAPAPPPPYRASTKLEVPQLQLACEPTAPLPPPLPAPRNHPAPAAPSITVRPRFGGVGSTSVLSSFPGLTDLPPFFTQAAPALRDSDRGVSSDVKELVERSSSAGSLARVYGWGPKTGDWDTLGRWQVKWLTPFAGWPEIRASLPALPPQVVVDMTRQGSGYPFGYNPMGRGDFQLAPGDDSSHALLVGKRMIRGDIAVFELEADRAPVEIRRADGEPFSEVEGVVRTAGRWFVTAPMSASATGAVSPVTVVWQIEGAIARELARVPRSTAEGSQAGRAKLARRSDGRAIALVVDGQPTVERASNVRWALPIDIESGALGEPDSLGYADLAGRTLEGCADEVGWVLDTSLPSSFVRIRLPQGSGSISNVTARLRLTSDRACIERLAGTYDGQSAERAAQLSRPGPARSGPPRTGELIVTAMSAQTRFPLKCSVGK